MVETEASCKRCALHLTRTQVVVGWGSPTAPVMFLGEAPGRQEDKLGRGFQGAAGRVFDDILNFLGLERQQIWLANAVRCRPSVEGKRNRAPRPEEISACRRWLEADVERIAPRIIVALGRTAFETATRTPWDGEKRGSPVPVPEFGAEVLALYHPAYLIYRRELKDAYRSDLVRLRSALVERGIGLADAHGPWADS